MLHKNAPVQNTSNFPEDTIISADIINDLIICEHWTGKVFRGDWDIYVSVCAQCEYVKLRKRTAC